jgi:hypothetical protein
MAIVNFAIGVMVLLAAAPASGQSSDGRWKLLATEDLRADGSVARHPWGPHLVGSIVVANGWCYLQIMSGDVPAISAGAAVGDQIKRLSSAATSPIPDRARSNGPGAALR